MWTLLLLSERVTANPPIWRWLSLRLKTKHWDKPPFHWLGLHVPHRTPLCPKHRHPPCHFPTPLNAKILKIRLVRWNETTGIIFINPNSICHKHKCYNYRQLPPVTTPKLLWQFPYDDEISNWICLQMRPSISINVI